MANEMEATNVAAEATTEVTDLVACATVESITGESVPVNAAKAEKPGFWAKVGFWFKNHKKGVAVGGAVGVAAVGAAAYILAICQEDNIEVFDDDDYDDYDEE